MHTSNCFNVSILGHDRFPLGSSFALPVEKPSVHCFFKRKVFQHFQLIIAVSNTKYYFMVHESIIVQYD